MQFFSIMRVLAGTRVALRAAKASHLAPSAISSHIIGLQLAGRRSSRGVMSGIRKNNKKLGKNKLRAAVTGSSAYSAFK
jgi:hypothetical protein